MPPKPKRAIVWLNDYVPEGDVRLFDARWLEEHVAYGASIHELTADAILEALKRPRNRYEGHALYLRLFAEYANALEAAGALGWAIRERKPGQLLLDTFLTYPLDSPRLFYEAARRNRSDSAVLLLRLPSESKVLAALDAASSESTSDHSKMLAQMVPVAKNLADRYLDDAVRFTYNRTKHGATMFHADSHSLREFAVIGPDLTRERRYVLAHFNVTAEQIQKMRHGVEVASAMIRSLSVVAKSLRSAGLLYR